MDWREARRTLWHVDLALLVIGLDEWTHTDENIARLVDREDYWLNSEYSSWVTDPKDPEVIAARERMQARRRAGYKPPPAPLLFPAAARPAENTVTLVNELLKKQQEYGLTGEVRPKDEKITIAELRSMRGR